MARQQQIQDGEVTTNTRDTTLTPTLTVMVTGLLFALVALLSMLSFVFFVQTKCHQRFIENSTPLATPKCRVGTSVHRIRHRFRRRNLE